MKNLLSIVLSILMLISIMVGVGFNVYASSAPSYRNYYCDICNEVRSYRYNPSIYEPPVPCTEEYSVILNCGHKKVLRAIKPHYVVAQINKTEGTASFICLDCGADLFTEPLTEESYSKCDHLTIQRSFDPTCEKNGQKDCFMCMCCGSIVSEGTIIPAKGHNLVSNYDGKKPACTELGYTDSYHCRRSGCDYITKREVIPALGHTTKTTGKKSATYFAKGHTEKTICKECGEVIKKGKSIAKLKLKTPKATVKGSKKKLTVKYKKVKDATGFQVKYKIGKKIITKTYNTKKTVTKTIKTLKKGTYKVYVRSFIRKGTNKAYSSWTKSKTVKVK